MLSYAELMHNILTALAEANVALPSPDSQTTEAAAAVLGTHNRKTAPQV